MVINQDVNIGFAFAGIAREAGEFPALVTHEYVLTYGDLWRMVYSFAKRLQDLGVDHDSVVALNTGEKVVSISALLATALLGAQFVPTDMELARQKPVKPTHFIKSAEAAGARAVAFIDIDESWLPTQDTPVDPDPSEFPGYSDRDAPWLILHTKGSTGRAKFIKLSQRIVFDRTRATHLDFPVGKLTLAPLYGCTTRPFFARAIGVLLNRCSLVDSPDINFWRQAGVNAVCCSPTQASKWFENIVPGRKFPIIEVAGGKLPEHEVRNLLDLFEEVHDVYGASETNKSFTNVITLGSNGRIKRRGLPVETTRVEVLNSHGDVCAPGQIGMIRVKNDYLAAGYINEPEATAKSFREDCFYPGDIASWGANGELEIIGRDDDVINLGGNKVDAMLIDLTMKLVPGVRDAICFKNPKDGAANELLAFVEFEDPGNRGSVTADLEEFCLKKIGLFLTPKKFRMINKVPRSEGGHPMRRECERLLLAAVQGDDV